MSDIFGRQPGDYDHYRSLAERGMLEEHLVAKIEANGVDAHNFRSLGTNGDLISKAEANAQAVGYIFDNLDAVNATIDEVMYTDFRLYEFIPMNTNVPEGVKQYSYQIMDQVGRGSFIEQPGSMPTNARVSLRHIGYPLYYAGIVPEWNLEDVRLAMTAGISLDSAVVQAGTVGAMDHIERVGLTGDTQHGLKGLINLTTGTNPADGEINLTTRPDSAQLISAMTGEEIAKFIQAEVVKFITDTAEVFGRRIKDPLTIYLPIKQAALITEAQMTVIHTDLTPWQYASVTNAWTQYTGKPLQLKWLAELAGAGKDANSATADRMIIAVNDKKVMEMAMSISPRSLTVLNMGYTIQAPMEYKISGLNIKRPAGIRYIDRI